MQFEMRLNVDQQMIKLLKKDEIFWRDLLNVYLVEVSNLLTNIFLQEYWNYDNYNSVLDIFCIHNKSGLNSE